MAVLATTSNPSFPTLLALVSRVRREVTKESLTTLNDDPVNNVIVDSINDAVEDIYYQDRWNWAKTTEALTFVANTSEYALPSRFYRMATEPEINNIQLKEVEPEEWARNTYTPSLTAQATVSGQPQVYYIDRSLIKFWPTPSSSFVTLTPTVTLCYYQRPGSRLALATDGGNSPDLPTEFIEAVVAFAKSRLKIFLQYDDWQIDDARYRECVQRQVQNDYQSVHPNRMRPRNWKTARFA